MLLIIAVILFVVFGVLGFIKSTLWAGLILASAFFVAHLMTASSRKS